MIWNFSVPETAGLAGDAPAGTASHTAAAIAATTDAAAAANEVIRFTAFPSPANRMDLFPPLEAAGARPRTGPLIRRATRRHGPANADLARQPAPRTFPSRPHPAGHLLSRPPARPAGHPGPLVPARRRQDHLGIGPAGTLWPWPGNSPGFRPAPATWPGDPHQRLRTRACHTRGEQPPGGSGTVAMPRQRVAGQGSLGPARRRRAGGGGITFPARARPAGITTSVPSRVRTVKDPAPACSRMPSTSVICLLSPGPGRRWRGRDPVSDTRTWWRYRLVT